jgi:predicted nucleotidyltransferase
MAGRLAGVGGVVGVTLGGSRARGTAGPNSDTDLGVYYRGELDVAGLRALATELCGHPVEVTGPGGWGPWVDGGAWLDLDGRAVDWVERDLDRVDRVWAEAEAGRWETGVQAGHPLGFSSYAYAGELALSRVLADPGGELASRREAFRAYPPALARALVAATWEAPFLLMVAAKDPERDDPAWLAGIVFRAVGVLVAGLHGHAGRWLVTEKGAVAAAGRLPNAPPRFTDRVARLLGNVGTTAADQAATVAAARELAAEVRKAIGAGESPW